MLADDPDYNGSAPYANLFTYLTINNLIKPGARGYRTTMGSTYATGTVLITGASSGIGRATALRYAQRGWRLVLSARGAHWVTLAPRPFSDSGSANDWCRKVAHRNADHCFATQLAS